MEKGNTKQQILMVALDLFSVQGYEATSIAQIADAVGVRKASLYSHYKSKQDILDRLMETVLDQYNRRSIFTNADWEDSTFCSDKKHMTPEQMTGTIKSQLHYIIHDPVISKVRKMLTIEQFRNEELKGWQTKQSYEDVLHYNLGQIRFLIREGILREEDPEIMAAQLAWPISMWMTLCDREPERETEVMELVDRHIQQFFKLYKK